MSERGKKIVAIRKSRWSAVQFVLLASLVAACAIGLAACGSSSSSSSNGGTSGGAGGGGEVTTENASQSSGAGDGSQLEKTTWLIPQDWQALDPTKVAATNEGTILLVFEPLVLANPKGGEPIDNLATQEHPTPTTYVYDVRKGDKFSDGNPLTMEDVLYSIELHTAKHSTSNLAELGEVVKSVKQTGPMQLTVTLNQPNLNYANLITEVGIVEKSVREEDGSHPGSPEAPNVGTGPYVVKTYRPGNEVVLERNEGYWGKKPPLKEITMKLVEDESSKLLAVRGGEATGAVEFPNSQVKVYESVPGMHVIEGPNPAIWMMAFNTEKGPFSDPHVRKAVSQVIDKEGLVKAILHETGSPAVSVVQQASAESVLSPSEASKLYEELNIYPLDEEAAKEEMAKSATPNGFSETIVYSAAEPDAGRIAQVVAQEVEPLGIKLNVKSLPDEQYTNEVFFEQTAPAAIVNYTTDLPDPISLPNYMTNSNNLLKNGGYTNISRWSSPEQDQALDSYLEDTSGSRAKKAELLSTALRNMTAEQPYIPIYYSNYLGILEEGLEFEDFNGFWYEYRWPELIKEAE
jgi:peptide/nickel transport system substrate-binding protein